MTGVSGQRMENLTKEALTKMRFDQSFGLFCFQSKLKVWLANQRFQESDALPPDWKLVLVHGPIPMLPKNTLDHLISSSVLSTRARLFKARLR